MENWKDIHIFDFLKEERTNCYWFWFAGKIKRKRNKETGEIYEQNLYSTGEWNGIRLMNGFYNCLDELISKYMNGKYNGQSKSEFEKNRKRVSDIWIKSDGDIDKAISLSKSQAARITDEWKAINRALAAKDMGYEEIFEVFFQRAYELGSVTKQEYRQYKLEKLGL